MVCYSFEHAKAKLDSVDLPMYQPIALFHEVMPEIQDASFLGAAPRRGRKVVPTRASQCRSYLAARDYMVWD